MNAMLAVLGGLFFLIQRLLFYNLFFFLNQNLFHLLNESTNAEFRELLGGHSKESHTCENIGKTIICHANFIS